MKLGVCCEIAVKGQKRDENAFIYLYLRTHTRIWHLRRRLRVRRTDCDSTT